jgi:hypothetical protein
MSLPVGQIVTNGVYEGASGQQRKIYAMYWRIIDYYPQYVVVKQGAPPENQPVGTTGGVTRKVFAAWAVKRIS